MISFALLKCFRGCRRIAVNECKVIDVMPQLYKME